MALASRLPLASGVVATRYYSNRFRAIPHALASAGYRTFSAAAEPPSFWNMRQMHAALGFARSAFLPDFKPAEWVGVGLNDVSFFEQVSGMLEQQQEPFMAYLLTSSNHHPYQLPAHLLVPDVSTGAGTAAGDYLQSVMYFDRAFGTKPQVDPIRHLIGTAAGWGGNPDKDAKYINVTPTKNDGTTVYKLNVKNVPVEAFWSVSVYNAQGYYEKNSYNAYSLNSVTAKKDAEGSVAIQFGGCDGKIPNCLPVMNGWNYTVRLYRPRAEVLSGKWKFPEPQPVNSRNTSTSSKAPSPPTAGGRASTRRVCGRRRTPTQSRRPSPSGWRKSRRCPPTTTAPRSRRSPTRRWPSA
jgi:hypothetical protein